LNAFEHLWRSAEAPELVIVGKPGWKTASLQSRIRSHPEIGQRLHWFDQVSDEELCLLYDACQGLFMTSHAEGFGLPLVEAAVHGKHVLARDLPVFREHNLANVLYFTSDAPEALAERLVELVAMKRKDDLVPAGLSTWAKCVDDLLRAVGITEGPASSAVPLLRIRS
jgi:glycosyltransferase involved in cell wall biosynthesis